MRPMPEKRHFGLTHRSLANSFDHFIGTGEQGRWNIDADRFSGFEIHYQFELDRLLDRKVGWFCALENLIDEDGGPAK